MRVVRYEELSSSGSEGNYTGGLATPKVGAAEVSVIRQRQEPGAVNPFHSHDREEVMVVLSGIIRLTTDEEESSLSSGDTAILPSGKRHQIQNDGDSDAEWILAAPAGISFIFADGTKASPEWAR